IDAIRIYLPLQDNNGWTATLDDNYWTVGKVGPASASSTYIVYSNSNGCSYYGSSTLGLSHLFYLGNSRTSPLSTACNSNTCSDVGMTGIRYTFDIVSDF